MPGGGRPPSSGVASGSAAPDGRPHRSAPSARRGLRGVDVVARGRARGPNGRDGQQALGRWRHGDAARPAAASTTARSAWHRRSASATCGPASGLASGTARTALHLPGPAAARQGARRIEAVRGAIDERARSRAATAAAPRRAPPPGGTVGAAARRHEQVRRQRSRNVTCWPWSSPGSTGGGGTGGVDGAPWAAGAAARGDGRAAASAASHGAAGSRRRRGPAHARRSPRRSRGPDVAGRVAADVGRRDERGQEDVVGRARRRQFGNLRRHPEQRRQRRTLLAAGGRERRHDQRGPDEVYPQESRIAAVSVHA